MSVRRVSAYLVASSIGISLLAGCEPTKDPLIDKARTELLVDINGDPASIEQTIAKLSETGNNMDPSLVLIKAKVGSGKGDTFESDTSAFLVSEVPDGEHAGDVAHDADNCPFCRAREAKAPTVVVRLIGKDGKPFSKGADKLLGLKKGQHLTIRGEGAFDPELNFLTIEADGIKVLD